MTEFEPHTLEENSLYFSEPEYFTPRAEIFHEKNHENRKKIQKRDAPGVFSNSKVVHFLLAFEKGKSRLSAKGRKAVQSKISLFQLLYFSVRIISVCVTFSCFIFFVSIFVNYVNFDMIRGTIETSGKLTFNNCLKIPPLYVLHETTPPFSM